MKGRHWREDSNDWCEDSNDDDEKMRWKEGLMVTWKEKTVERKLSFKKKLPGHVCLVSFYLCRKILMRRGWNFLFLFSILHETLSQVLIKWHSTRFNNAKMSLGALGKNGIKKRDWNSDEKIVEEKERERMGKNGTNEKQRTRWRMMKLRSSERTKESERMRESEWKREETATSLKFGLLGSNTLFSFDCHDCVHHNVIQLAYFLLSFTSNFLSLLALNGIHSLILSGKVNENFLLSFCYYLHPK